MADSVCSPVSLLMIYVMTKLGSHFTKYLNNVEVESTAVSSVQEKTKQGSFAFAMINDISWWFPRNRKWSSY